MSQLNEKHISDLKGKYWDDREIIHAIEFEPSGTFEAVSKAIVYLKELGYYVASICSNMPIAFMYNYSYVPKWKNLSDKERDKIEGVIIPQHEFGEGGVIILFFVPPRY